MEWLVPTGLKQFESQAVEVAQILRALANERRLMIVCLLVELGESKVSTLADEVGLTQSALSQHLAKMRGEKLLAARRDGQSIWYRIADPRIEKLFAVMHELFCKPAKAARRRASN